MRKIFKVKVQNIYSAVAVFIIHGISIMVNCLNSTLARVLNKERHFTFLFLSFNYFGSAYPEALQERDLLW